jgi:hypothetical protein
VNEFLIGMLVMAALVIGWLLWERRAWASERRHLQNALIARHPGELIALDRAETRKPVEESPAVKLSRQLDNPVGR